MLSLGDETFMSMAQTLDNLFGKTLHEIKEIVKELSIPSYSTEQICDWLYKKNIDSIDKMSNLSKSARTELSKKYTIVHHEPLDIQVSSDGTKKYLFQTLHSRYIETAYVLFFLFDRKTMFSGPSNVRRNFKPNHQHSLKKQNYQYCLYGNG